MTLKEMDLNQLSSNYPKVWSSDMISNLDYEQLSLIGASNQIPKISRLDFDPQDIPGEKKECCIW